MSKFNPQKNDLARLRKGVENSVKRKTAKKEKPTLPELEHELTVYEVELKMQNISLFNTLEKLTAAHLEYEELFELSPVGYFILNKDGAIEKVNERGSEQLGIERLLLHNRPFSTFINGEADQDNFYRHINQVMEDGKPARLVCELKKRDGGSFSVNIKTGLVRDEQLKFKHLLVMVGEI